MATNYATLKPKNPGLISVALDDLVYFLLACTWHDAQVTRSHFL